MAAKLEQLGLDSTSTTSSLPLTSLDFTNPSNRLVDPSSVVTTPQKPDVATVDPKPIHTETLLGALTFLSARLHTGAQTGDSKGYL